MGRKAGSGGGLGHLSIRDLHAEIRKRERAASGLLRRRDRLAARLAEVEDQIREAGLSSPGGGGGVRPRNEMSLVEALGKILKGKTMSVTDAAEAVQSAGYKTSAANFRTIVNQALIKNTKVFKKVGRGQYTAT
ncbi:MAG TPA: hypothetical protein VK176_13110 [Phycisphaerales bacterium]|nr:hypothetical protein [Phycisphaerales bacterium]